MGEWFHKPSWKEKFKIVEGKEDHISNQWSNRLKKKSHEKKALIFGDLHLEQLHLECQDKSLMGSPIH